MPRQSRATLAASRSSGPSAALLAQGFSKTVLTADNAGDLYQARRAHPVGPFHLLLDLRKLSLTFLHQGLLGHAGADTQLADAIANGYIYEVRCVTP